MTIDQKRVDYLCNAESARLAGSEFGSALRNDSETLMGILNALLALAPDDLIVAARARRDEETETASAAQKSVQDAIRRDLDG